MCLRRSWSWSVTNVPTSRRSSDLIGSIINVISTCLFWEVRPFPNIFRLPPTHTEDKTNTSRLILLKIKQADKTAISCWSNSKDLTTRSQTFISSGSYWHCIFQLKWLDYCTHAMEWVCKRIFHAQQRRTLYVAHSDFMVKQLFTLCLFSEAVYFTSKIFLKPSTHTSCSSTQETILIRMLTVSLSCVNDWS